MEYLEIVLLI